MARRSHLKSWLHFNLKKHLKHGHVNEGHGYVILHNTTRVHNTPVNAWDKNNKRPWITVNAVIINTRMHSSLHVYYSTSDTSVHSKLHRISYFQCSLREKSTKKYSLS